MLRTILAHKRESVARRKADRPLDSFRSSLAPAGHRLRAVFRPDRPAFLLECKKASPSRGLLRPDYDPAALAEAYAPVADAVSVLADGPFFQGSLEHVRQVRARVDLPVLCKDFVVDPYQVYEARLYGADAVLLMLSVLDDPLAADCLAAARALGMDALVEVRDEAEMRRAGRLGARLVGVNNRDFRTLRTDLATTERLAPLAPPGALVVGESGVRDRADVERLSPLVNGFLVGTALMAHPSPGLAARELLCGRVKVCGLTSPADAAAAWRAGAVLGGLIFAAESPRRVDLDRAGEIRAAAPLGWVGVFVDDDPGLMVQAARELGLQAVQLHGEEEPSCVRRLRRSLPEGVEIWKARRVAGEIPPLDGAGADRVLLDTHRPGRRGGTGEAFDWSLLRPGPERDRLVIAGGLHPGNVRRAAALGAWAVDVNSGVESAPGVKDPALLRRLFDALRAGPARNA